MMETSAPRRKLPLAAILTSLAGVLTIVGSVIAWATVKANVFGEVTQSVKGTDGSDGKITLVLGIVLVIAGVVLFLVRTGGARRVAAVMALLAGLVVAGIGVYDIIDIKTNALDELITQLGSDPDTLTDEQRAQFEEAVQISVAPGLYLVVAAGLLGLIGGVMGLRREPAAAVPAAPTGQAPAGAPMDTGFGTAPSAGAGTPPAPPPSAPPSPPDPPASPSVP